MVRIVAVRSHQVGSRLICWGLGEGASHLGIEFPGLGFYYHSFLTGVRPMPRAEFERHYQIVEAVTVDVPSEWTFHKEFALLADEIPYDYGALAYFAWRAALRKLGRVPLPQANPWDNRGKFLCTEALYLFAEVLASQTGQVILFDEAELSITSPLAALRYLKEKLSHGPVRSTDVPHY